MNDTTKPFCVFGIAETERGIEIADKMLQWLRPNFNVIEIRHDGTLFEQPALRYMQDLCKRTGKPCLYLHTKGAYKNRPIAPRVHSMWEHEFVSRMDEYFSVVDSEEPTVACPYTGFDKTTWYNGFVANAAAMSAIELIEPNENRWHFERLFIGTDVNVKGLVMDNIDRGNEDRIHTMQHHIATFK